MELLKKILIKAGFSDRQPIKARFHADDKLSKFKSVEVGQLTDEGKEFISIGTVSSWDSKDERVKASVFFHLDDIPAVIATLKKASLESQERNFLNEIKWQEEELNNN